MPLRNSLHRRNHKERSQLAHREKLGILEKHADYVKRARDYHFKQDRLQRLKQKAADRNKDEFYFSMSKEKTKGGIHVKSRGNPVLPQDILKVLKTQDENYVRTMRASNRKKVDRLKGRLTAMVDLTSQPAGAGEQLDEVERQILTEAGIMKEGKLKSKSRHQKFEQAMEEIDGMPHEEGGKLDDDDLGWKEANSVKQKIMRRRTQQRPLENPYEDLPQSTDPTRKQLIKELGARIWRDKHLRYAEREFEMQRAMMGKGARQRIRGGDEVMTDEDDEDEEDAFGGRKEKVVQKFADEKTYRPRVYKWRLQRSK